SSYAVRLARTRSAWLGGGPLFDPFQPVSERAAFRLEFEAILQVHPELGGRAEVAAEPQRRVGGEATLSVREPPHPARRHVAGGPSARARGAARSACAARRWLPPSYRPSG